jgi:hypothetical protein
MAFKSKSKNTMEVQLEKSQKGKTQKPNFEKKKNRVYPYIVMEFLKIKLHYIKTLCSK